MLLHCKKHKTNDIDKGTHFLKMLRMCVVGLSFSYDELKSQMMSVGKLVPQL